MGFLFSGESRASRARTINKASMVTGEQAPETRRLHYCGSKKRCRLIGTTAGVDAAASFVQLDEKSPKKIGRR